MLVGGRDTLKEMINEATEQVQSCDLDWAQEELPDALLGISTTTSRTANFKCGRKTLKVARVDELRIELEHARSERPLPQQSPQLSRHDPGTRSNCTVASLVKNCLLPRMSAVLGPTILDL